MKKSNIFVLIVLSIITFCCKEVYVPEITDTQKILVVDGFITNEPKAHTIRLSTAIRFDSTGYASETGATVYITDNYGNRFDFKELGNGNYTSDPVAFKAQIGTKYTLTIETKNKMVYKSSVQEMLPKGTLNEVSNTAKTKPYNLSVNGELRSFNVKGTEFIASLNFNSESYPYFRFTNSVLVEFIKNFSFAPETLYYCWKKYNPNEYFNINDRQYNTSNQADHDLGFCPLDTLFYSIIKERVDIQGSNPPKHYFIFNNIYQYIVSFKQYHLNEDAYIYYDLLNKQLQAKQRILDPVTFQISGNITCISDPNEKVFGLFEVSSANVFTYIIDRNLISTSYRLRAISFDLDSISDSGIHDSIPPSFWIY